MSKTNLCLIGINALNHLKGETTSLIGNNSNIQSDCISRELAKFLAPNKVMVNEH